MRCGDDKTWTECQEVSGVSSIPQAVTWENDAPILVRCKEIKLDKIGGTEK